MDYRTVVRACHKVYSVCIYKISECHSILEVKHSDLIIHEINSPAMVNDSTNMIRIRRTDKQAGGRTDGQTEGERLDNTLQSKWTEGNYSVKSRCLPKRKTNHHYLNMVDAVLLLVPQYVGITLQDAFSYTITLKFAIFQLNGHSHLGMEQ